MRIAFQRSIATGVAFTFFFTNILIPLPQLEAREVNIPSYPQFTEFRVPPELGTIEEMREGKKGPFVIHIQTAHGNYENAKKIEALLGHFSKEYGIERVFLEGAAGRLDPELDRTFKEPRWNRQVLEYRAKQGQASGASLFILDAPSHIETLGIESPTEYRKNRRAFQEAFRARENAQKALDKFNREIENLSSTTLSKPLRDFVLRREAFEAGRFSPLDYFRYLHKSAKKSLGLNLLNPAAQKDWPNLVRLARLQKIEGLMDRKEIENEKEIFLKKIKRFLSDPIFQDFKNLLGDSSQLPYAHVRFLLERTADLLPPAFSFDRYPHLKTRLQFLVFQNELDGTSLLGELDRFADEIQMGLAGDEKSKATVKILGEYRLLKRLFDLELRPEDYKAIVETGQKETAEPITRFSGYGDTTSVLWSKPIPKEILLQPVKHVKNAEGVGVEPISQYGNPGYRPGPRTDGVSPSAAGSHLTQLQTNIEYINSQLNIDNKLISKSSLQELERLYEKALEFYRGAKIREAKMVKNIVRMSNGTNKPVVVITGGFHTPGLKEFFKSNGLAFASVTPKLTEAGSRQGYLDSILEKRPPIFQEATLEDALAYTEIPPAILKRLGVDPAVARQLKIRDLLFSEIPWDQSLMDETNESPAAKLYGFRLGLEGPDIRIEDETGIRWFDPYTRQIKKTKAVSKIRPEVRAVEVVLEKEEVILKTDKGTLTLAKEAKAHSAQLNGKIPSLLKEPKIFEAVPRGTDEVVYKVAKQTILINPKAADYVAQLERVLYQIHPQLTFTTMAKKIQVLTDSGLGFPISIEPKTFVSELPGRLGVIFGLMKSGPDEVKATLDSQSRIKIELLEEKVYSAKLNDPRQVHDQLRLALIRLGLLMPHPAGGIKAGKAPPGIGPVETFTTEMILSDLGKLGGLISPGGKYANTYTGVILVTPDPTRPKTELRLQARTAGKNVTVPLSTQGAVELAAPLAEALRENKLHLIMEVTGKGGDLDFLAGIIYQILHTKVDETKLKESFPMLSFNLKPAPSGYRTLTVRVPAAFRIDGKTVADIMNIETAGQEKNITFRFRQDMDWDDFLKALLNLKDLTVKVAKVVNETGNTLVDDLPVTLEPFQPEAPVPSSGKSSAEISLKRAKDHIPKNGLVVVTLGPKKAASAQAAKPAVVQTKWDAFEKLWRNIDRLEKEIEGWKNKVDQSRGSLDTLERTPLNILPSDEKEWGRMKGRVRDLINIIEKFVHVWRSGGPFKAERDGLKKIHDDHVIPRKPFSDNAAGGKALELFNGLRQSLQSASDEGKRLYDRAEALHKEATSLASKLEASAKKFRGQDKRPEVRAITPAEVERILSSENNLKDFENLIRQAVQSRLDHLSLTLVLVYQLYISKTSPSVLNNFAKYIKDLRAELIRRGENPKESDPIRYLLFLESIFIEPKGQISRFGAPETMVPGYSYFTHSTDDRKFFYFDFSEFLKTRGQRDTEKLGTELDRETKRKMMRVLLEEKGLLVSTIKDITKNHQLTERDIQVPTLILSFQYGRYQNVHLVLAILKDGSVVPFTFLTARSIEASEIVKHEFENLKAHEGDRHVAQALELGSWDGPGGTIYGYTSQYLNGFSEFIFNWHNFSGTDRGVFVKNSDLYLLAGPVKIGNEKIFEAYARLAAYFYDSEKQRRIQAFQADAGDANLSDDRFERIQLGQDFLWEFKVKEGTEPLEARLIGFRGYEENVDVPHFMAYFFSLEYLEFLSPVRGQIRHIVEGNLKDEIRNGVMQGFLNGLKERYGLNSQTVHPMAADWLGRYLAEVDAKRISEDPIFDRAFIEQTLRQLTTDQQGGSASGQTRLEVRVWPSELLEWRRIEGWIDAAAAFQAVDHSKNPDLEKQRYPPFIRTFLTNALNPLPEPEEGAEQVDPFWPYNIAFAKKELWLNPTDNAKIRTAFFEPSEDQTLLQARVAKLKEALAPLGEVTENFVGVNVPTHFMGFDPKTHTGSLHYIDPEQGLIFFSFPFLDSLDQKSKKDMDLLRLEIQEARREIIIQKLVLASDPDRIDKWMLAARELDRINRVVSSEERRQTLPDYNVVLRNLRTLDENIREQKIKNEIPRIQNLIRHFEDELKGKEKTGTLDRDDRTVYDLLIVLYNELVFLQERMGWTEERALATYLKQVKAIAGIQTVDEGQAPALAQEQKAYMYVWARQYDNFLKALQIFLAAPFERVEKSILGYPRPLKDYERGHLFNLLSITIKIYEPKYLSLLKRRQSKLPPSQWGEMESVIRQVRTLFAQAKRRIAIHEAFLSLSKDAVLREEPELRAVVTDNMPDAAELAFIDRKDIADFSRQPLLRVSLIFSEEPSSEGRFHLYLSTPQEIPNDHLLIRALPKIRKSLENFSERFRISYTDEARPQDPEQAALLARQQVLRRLQEAEQKINGVVAGVPSAGDFSIENRWPPSGRERLYRFRLADEEVVVKAKLGEYEIIFPQVQFKLTPRGLAGQGWIYDLSEEDQEEFKRFFEQLHDVLANDNPLLRKVILEVEKKLEKLIREGQDEFERIDFQVDEMRRAIRALFHQEIEKGQRILQGLLEGIESELQYDRDSVLKFFKQPLQEITRDLAFFSPVPSVRPEVRAVALSASLIALGPQPAEKLIQRSLDAIRAGAKHIHIAYVDKNAPFVGSDAQDTIERFEPKWLGRMKKRAKSESLDASFDVHLEIANPEKDLLRAFIEEGADSIATHYEAFEDEEILRQRLQDIRRLSKEKTAVGLAIRPDADSEKISQFLNRHPQLVDYVLQLGVEPGKAGQKFKPEVLDHMRFLKDHGFIKPFRIDGGVNEETAKLIRESGLDVEVIVAGSAFFGKENEVRSVEALGLAVKQLLATPPVESPKIEHLSQLRLEVRAAQTVYVKPDEDIVEAARKKYGSGKTDWAMGPIVKLDADGKAKGRIQEGDEVYGVNTRLDRMKQLTAAFVGRRYVRGFPWLTSSWIVALVEYLEHILNVFIVKLSKRFLWFQGRRLTLIIDEHGQFYRPPVNFNWTGASLYDPKLAHRFAGSTLKPEATEIDKTLTEFLSEKLPAKAGEKNIIQITHKAKGGHITYYSDGKRSIARSNVMTEIVPNTDDYALNARRIADALIATATQKEYQIQFTEDPTKSGVGKDNVYALARNRFIRVNFPDGDEAGHKNYAEASKAVRAIDKELKRIVETLLAYARENKVTVRIVIGADHGSAEAMANAQGEVLTNHSSNPVRIIYIDPENLDAKLKQPALDGKLAVGLANEARTIVEAMGFTPADGVYEVWEPSMFEAPVRAPSSEKPLVMIKIILDGWGVNPDPNVGPGIDAIRDNAPNLAELVKNYPTTLAGASGKFVGLREKNPVTGEPPIGSSEVGHDTMGDGRIPISMQVQLDQYLDKPPGEKPAFKEDTPGLREALDRATKNKKNFHLIGQASEGDIHSSLEHFYAVLRLAAKIGFKQKIYIHAGADGEDTPIKMTPDNLLALQAVIDEMKPYGVDAEIVSVLDRKHLMDKNQRHDLTEIAYRALVAHPEDIHTLDHLTRHWDRFFAAQEAAEKLKKAAGTDQRAADEAMAMTIRMQVEALDDIEKTLTRIHQAEAVVSDIVGTFLKGDHRTGLDEFLNHALGLNADEKVLDDLNNAIFKGPPIRKINTVEGRNVPMANYIAHTLGEATEEEFINFAFYQFRLIFGQKFDEALSGKSAGEFFKAYFKPFEETDAENIETARQLQKKGISVIGLSNKFPRKWQHLKKAVPFLSELDGVVLSYEIGARKPMPRMYRALKQEIKAVRQRKGVRAASEIVDLSKAIYIDSEDSNRRAATDMGLLAVQKTEKLKDNEVIQEILTEKHLNEVKQRLAQIARGDSGFLPETRHAAREIMDRLSNHPQITRGFPILLWIKRFIGQFVSSVHGLITRVGGWLHRRKLSWAIHEREFSAPFPSSSDFHLGIVPLYLDAAISYFSNDRIHQSNLLLAKENLKENQIEEAEEIIRHVRAVSQGEVQKLLTRAIVHLKRARGDVWQIEDIDYDTLKNANSQSPLAIKAQAIFVSLVGFGFKRFTLSEGIKDPEQTPVRYGEALRQLIKRFGEEAFTAGAAALFDRDLENLDFHSTVLYPLHKTGNLHKMHSDILPAEDIRLMELVPEFIGKAYPIEPDMEKEGDLVNVQTLFGDSDFWDFLRVGHAGIFQRLVSHIENWPAQIRIKSLRAGSTAQVSVHPIGLFRKYFSQSYESILAGQPEFSDKGQGPIAAVKLPPLPDRRRPRGTEVADEFQASDVLVDGIVAQFNRKFFASQIKLEPSGEYLVGPANELIPLLTAHINEKKKKLDLLESEIFEYLLSQLKPEEFVQAVSKIKSTSDLAKQVVPRFKGALNRIASQIPNVSTHRPEVRIDIGKFQDELQRAQDVKEAETVLDQAVKGARNLDLAPVLYHPAVVEAAHRFKSKEVMKVYQAAIDKHFSAILSEIAQGRPPTTDELAMLESTLQTDPVQTTILDITPEKSASDLVRQRIEVMQKAWPGFSQYWNSYVPGSHIPADTLWRVYIPFSQWIANEARKKKERGEKDVYKVYLYGSQGRGKTVTSRALVPILNVLFDPIEEGQGVTRAIDDYYLGKTEREKMRLMGYDAGPEASNRGPAGTHDTDWIKRNLKESDESTPSSVMEMGNFLKRIDDNPRKHFFLTPLYRFLSRVLQFRGVKKLMSFSRIKSFMSWLETYAGPVIFKGKVAVYILDGWMYPDLDFDINQIPPGFKRTVAEKLQTDYKFFEDFDAVFAFDTAPEEEIIANREEQERKMLEREGKRGMSSEGVIRFVKYFVHDGWQEGITSPIPSMKNITFFAVVDPNRRIKSIEKGGRGEVKSDSLRGAVFQLLDEAAKQLEIARQAGDDKEKIKKALVLAKGLVEKAHQLDPGHNLKGVDLHFHAIDSMLVQVGTAYVESFGDFETAFGLTQLISHGQEYREMIDELIRLALARKIPVKSLLGYLNQLGNWENIVRVEKIMDAHRAVKPDSDTEQLLAASVARLKEGLKQQLSDSLRNELENGIARLDVKLALSEWENPDAPVERRVVAAQKIRDRKMMLEVFKIQPPAIFFQKGIRHMLGSEGKSEKINLEAIHLLNEVSSFVSKDLRYDPILPFYLWIFELMESESPAAYYSPKVYLEFIKGFVNLWDEFTGAENFYARLAEALKLDDSLDESLSREIEKIKKNLEFAIRIAEEKKQSEVEDADTLLIKRQLGEPYESTKGGEALLGEFIYKERPDLANNLPLASKILSYAVIQINFSRFEVRAKTGELIQRLAEYVSEKQPVETLEITPEILSQKYSEFDAVSFEELQELIDAYNRDPAQAFSLSPVEAKTGFYSITPRAEVPSARMELRTPPHSPESARAEVRVEFDMAKRKDVVILLIGDSKLENAYRLYYGSTPGYDMQKNFHAVRNFEEAVALLNQGLSPHAILYPEITGGENPFKIVYADEKDIPEHIPVMVTVEVLDHEVDFQGVIRTIESVIADEFPQFARAEVREGPGLTMDQRKDVRILIVGDVAQKEKYQAELMALGYPAKNIQHELDFDKAAKILGGADDPDEPPLHAVLTPSLSEAGVAQLREIWDKLKNKPVFVSVRPQGPGAILSLNNGKSHASIPVMAVPIFQNIWKSKVEVMIVEAFKDFINQDRGRFFRRDQEGEEPEIRPEVRRPSTFEKFCKDYWARPENKLLRPETWPNGPKIRHENFKDLLSTYIRTYPPEGAPFLFESGEKVVTLSDYLEDYELEIIPGVEGEEAREFYLHFTTPNTSPEGVYIAPTLDEALELFSLFNHDTQKAVRENSITFLATTLSISFVAILIQLAFVVFGPGGWIPLVVSVIAAIAGIGILSEHIYHKLRPYTFGDAIQEKISGMIRHYQNKKAKQLWELHLYVLEKKNRSRERPSPQTAIQTPRHHVRAKAHPTLTESGTLRSLPDKARAEARMPADHRNPWGKAGAGTDWAKEIMKAVIQSNLTEARRIYNHHKEELRNNFTNAQLQSLKQIMQVERYWMDPKNVLTQKSGGLFSGTTKLGDSISYSHSAQAVFRVIENSKEAPGRIIKIAVDREKNIQLLQEAITLIKLQQDPAVSGVPRLQRMGLTSDDYLWIELDGIERAQSMGGLAKPENPVQLFDLAIKFAKILKAVHNKKILHNDIHPGNLLFNKEGKVQLNDFGISSAGPAIVYEFFKGFAAMDRDDEAPINPKGYDTDIFSFIFNLAYLLEHHIRNSEPNRTSQLKSVQRHYLAKIYKNVDVPYTAIITGANQRPREEWPQKIDDLIPELEADRLNVAKAFLSRHEVRANKEEIEVLIIQLKGSSNVIVRRKAAEALGKIGPEAKAAIPDLIQALKDPDLFVQRNAVWALGKIGPAAVPRLIQALKDPEERVRRYAVWALGRIGPHTKDAVPALIEALKDPEERVRRYAVWALGSIGPEAKAAVPDLIKALKDRQIRETVIETLETILPSLDSIPLLSQLLLAPDPDLQAKAAQRLFFLKTGTPLSEWEAWKNLAFSEQSFFVTHSAEISKLYERHKEELTRIYPGHILLFLRDSSQGIPEEAFLLDRRSSTPIQGMVRVLVLGKETEVGTVWNPRRLVQLFQRDLQGLNRKEKYLPVEEYLLSREGAKPVSELFQKLLEKTSGLFGSLSPDHFKLEKKNKVSTLQVKTKDGNFLPILHFKDPTYTPEAGIQEPYLVWLPSQIGLRKEGKSLILTIQNQDYKLQENNQGVLTLQLRAEVRLARPARHSSVLAPLSARAEVRNIQEIVELFEDVFPRKQHKLTGVMPLRHKDYLLYVRPWFSESDASNVIVEFHVVRRDKKPLSPDELKAISLYSVSAVHPVTGKMPPFISFRVSDQDLKRMKVFLEFNPEWGPFFKEGRVEIVVQRRRAFQALAQALTSFLTRFQKESVERSLPKAYSPDFEWMIERVLQAEKSVINYLGGTEKKLNRLDLKNAALALVYLNWVLSQKFEGKFQNQKKEILYLNDQIQNAVWPESNSSNYPFGFLAGELRRIHEKLQERKKDQNKKFEFSLAFDRRRAKVQFVSESSGLGVGPSFSLPPSVLSDMKEKRISKIEIRPRALSRIIAVGTGRSHMGLEGRRGHDFVSILSSLLTEQMTHHFPSQKVKLSDGSFALVLLTRRDTLRRAEVRSTPSEPRVLSNRDKLARINRMRPVLLENPRVVLRVAHQILDNVFIPTDNLILDFFRIPSAIAAPPAEQTFQDLSRNAVNLLSTQKAIGPSQFLNGQLTGSDAKVGFVVGLKMFEKYAPLFVAWQKQYGNQIRFGVVTPGNQDEASMVMHVANAISRDLPPDQWIIPYTNATAAMTALERKKFFTIEGLGLPLDAVLLNKVPGFRPKTEAQMDQVVSGIPGIEALLAEFSAQFQRALETAA